MTRRRLRLLLLLVLVSTASVVGAILLSDFARNDRAFFVRAAQAWSEVGWAVYAENPDYQIGPPVIWLLALGDPWWGQNFLITLLIVLMVAWPLIALWALAVARREGHVTDLGDVVLVAVGAVTWVDLCVWAHIDDALAALLLLGALSLRGRPLACGALVGLAAACKPWAIIGVAMAPRKPWAFLAAMGGVVMVFALPFVLAEPGSLTSSGGFVGYIHPGSLWRLMGFEVNDQPPTGFRVLELAVLFAVAWWLGRKVGPAAAMVAVLAVRIAAEPGTHSYYVAPLVLVLLASGLPTSRRLAAGGAAAVLWFASNTEANLPVSVVRLGVCVLIVLAVLAPERWTARRGAESARPASLSGSG